jgi:hypothetical protein
VPDEDCALSLRRASRVDENHGTIVNAFRQLGAYVVDLSRVGGGVPDLAVGVAGQMRFVEVKKDAKAKFTGDQLDFMTWWVGPPVIRVETVDQAVEVVKRMRDLK